MDTILTIIAIVVLVFLVIGLAFLAIAIYKIMGTIREGIYFIEDLTHPLELFKNLKFFRFSVKKKNKKVVNIAMDKKK